jgi:hypothetical protein
MGAMPSVSPAAPRRREGAAPSGKQMLGQGSLCHAQALSPLRRPFINTATPRYVDALQRTQEGVSAPTGADNLVSVISENVGGLRAEAHGA